MAVLVFVLGFAVPVTVYSLVSRSSDFDVRNQAAEEESTNISVPRIVSIPVTEISVNEKYSYTVKAVDDDGDELEYIVNNKPDWLDWDSDLKLFDGRPGTDDTGDFDVEISVSDGKWLDTQKFKISVEGGVLGVQSSRVVSSSPSRETTTEVSNDGSTLSAGDDLVSSNLSDMNIPEVLGESATTLPDTAISKGVLALSFGAGIVCVAFFLLADARFGLVDRVMTGVNYSKGRQISFRVGDGRVVKKRSVKI